ncbi:hypothetical protein GGX14DRAFT_561499 [Mycena pura]|uniref:Uncharacterized protein n=1 Tax=Mycena pura TaxID=153505 RepID=A0AAD6VUQ8_9AGAR|nr:hypothetical protein GGX14DRAFT_561499 [Mycena pura]
MEPAHPSSTSHCSKDLPLPCVPGALHGYADRERLTPPCRLRNCAVVCSGGIGLDVQPNLGSTYSRATRPAALPGDSELFHGAINPPATQSSSTRPSWYAQLRRHRRVYV